MLTVLCSSLDLALVDGHRLVYMVVSFPLPYNKRYIQLFNQCVPSFHLYFIFPSRLLSIQEVKCPVQVGSSGMSVRKATFEDAARLIPAPMVYVLIAVCHFLQHYNNQRS